MLFAQCMAGRVQHKVLNTPGSDKLGYYFWRLEGESVHISSVSRYSPCRFLFLCLTRWGNRSQLRSDKTLRFSAFNWNFTLISLGHISQTNINVNLRRANHRGRLYREINSVPFREIIQITTRQLGIASNKLMATGSHTLCMIHVLWFYFCFHSICFWNLAWVPFFLFWKKSLWFSDATVYSDPVTGSHLSILNSIMRPIIT